jgi:hypothetical protein
MTTPLVIETLSLVAPLGLCFHDAATDEKVNDGLSVSVYPAAQKNIKNIWRKRTEAFPNRSGVYVLHKAYGLEEFTRGVTADAEFDKEDKDKKPFIVEVVDNENRFQSFQFQLTLPVRGIYKWKNIPNGSPNQTLPSIPLFSAATRKASGGMSVIRAELHESIEKAASFAVLETRLNGNRVARGIADKDGKIALFFPSLSPPESATRVPLAEQQWLLDLTIRYKPSPPVSGSDEEKFPDLELLAQATGKLWANEERTEKFEQATLRFGKELILRSRAKTVPGAEPTDSSFLFVNPAP